MSRTSVTRHLEKAAEHEISWLLPEGMGARTLEQLLFPSVATPTRTPVIPNWQEVATELQAHYHLTLLWLDYKGHNLPGPPVSTDEKGDIKPAHEDPRHFNARHTGIGEWNNRHVAQPNPSFGS
ncbi:MAG: hypothetical protein ACYDED_15095 [Ferrimicrobium sp.]